MYNKNKLRKFIKNAIMLLIIGVAAYSSFTNKLIISLDFLKPKTQETDKTIASSSGGIDIDTGAAKKNGAIEINENNMDYVYEVPDEQVINNEPTTNDYENNNESNYESNSEYEYDNTESNYVKDNSNYIIDSFDIIDSNSQNSLSKSGTTNTSKIQTPVQHLPALRINNNDGKIYDSNGNEVVLKGVVIPSVDTIQFGAAIDLETLQSLKKNLGINMIRFTLNPVQDPTDNYNFPVAFYRIKTAIANAEKAGLYVIVNWGIMNNEYGDPRKTLSSSNFNKITTADIFFESLAKYTKDENKTNVLFEICNEPFVKEGPSKYENANTWTAVKEYSDVIIPLIRKYSDGIVIVAGKSGVILNEIVKDPITKYSNIAYTFHLYPYNYKYDTYKPQLEAAIDKKLTIIATEAGIFNASLSSNKNTLQYNTAKMDQYLEFFKSKNYNLHFAYFKYTFPYENELYSEWAMLKPLNQNYYETRCNTWKAFKDTEVCKQESLYRRHFTNNDLSSELASKYRCATIDNKCNKDIGKGVFSFSGTYFLEKFMNKKI